MTSVENAATKREPNERDKMPIPGGVVTSIDDIYIYVMEGTDRVTYSRRYYRAT